MDEERLVQVYASGDATDGALMQGRLESEGISVLLKGESEGPYPTGPSYLWVAAKDEALARQVIEAVRSGAYALDDDADVTGETEAEAEDAAPR